MLDFSTIFSSRAKYLVLRVLSIQSQPIPLRHIAYLTELPVFSVQTALKQLAAERVVNRSRRKRFVLFMLNPMKEGVELIKDFFSMLRKADIEQRAKTYHEKANSVLTFSAEMHEIFSKARAKLWT